jgi:histidyl-tRNA synthetase
LQHLTRLRGFQDWIGPNAEALSLVERTFSSVAQRHGFHEIRIPTVERVELYARSTGDTSDIVEKQMYVFTDKDEAETSIVLRPEGTPGVVRAYIEAGLDRSDPEQRLYYSGAMFRRERPQKGRYRQFYQFGVEVFGRADAACDAEVILMIDELQRELGVEFRFEINSIGDGQCRPQFREAVYQFGKAHYDELCADCKNRLERNPIRLLDCKTDNALMEHAPKSADYLCEPCQTHFAQVKELLTAGGVNYIENPRLVRGLDYYTRTTFEIIATGLGSQSTVVAGGRYDGLIEALGGAAVPGIGFGCGLERVALALEAAGKLLIEKTDAAIIAMGEAATLKAISIARTLRDSGLSVEMFSPERKLKALLSRANKIGARYAIIIGENEIAKGVVVLRDLASSTQREVPEADLPDAINSSR